MLVSNYRTQANSIGKRVVAQRVPLCEPGTFNTVLGYAGKQAIVDTARPSKFPAFSAKRMARMVPRLAR